jgi:hypothetical protein
VEFCQSTSLHGLQYIGEKNRHVLERWARRLYYLSNTWYKVSMFVIFDVRYFVSSLSPNILLLLLSYISGSKNSCWNHVANESACHVLLLSSSPLSAQLKCLAPGEEVLFVPQGTRQF